MEAYIHNLKSHSLANFSQYKIEYPLFCIQGISTFSIFSTNIVTDFLMLMLSEKGMESG